MDNIIYVEETVTEKVFEGDLILDGRMTPQEEREFIFKTMREAGIPVEKEEEFQIGFEGASDDNGISETQTSHYVVTRTYQKPVPYRKKLEEIYSGIWILDGQRISPEEQRRKILNIMKKDGIEIENEDDIEIGFEGAEDDYGISDTQSTKFVVYKVTKEKLSEDEKAIIEEERTLQDIYKELVELGEKLHATTNADEIAKLSDRITELSTKMDELVSESSRDYEPFEEALKDLESQITALYDVISNYHKEYEASFERMKKIQEEYASMAKDGSTEYETRIKELIEKAKIENEQSIEIRKKIKEQTEELGKLVKKRKRIRKDFEMAQQLGISAMEYQELTASIRSRKLVTAIIEKKGLGELIAIPAKERTPEQKRQIRAIRQEILEELAKAKREKTDSSILDLVEALYGIETRVELKGKQRVLIIKPTSLENMKNNIAKMPEKIAVPEDIDKDYVPGEAPEDMKEVMENKTDEIHDVIDLFTFYTDERYPDKIFARANVFERFDVEELGPGVRINGALCFEISKEDVEQIKANKDNDYSPYIIHEETVTIEDELERGKTIVKEKEEVTSNKREILPSEESDEYIPGTNFKRPRYRRNDETDEEYEAFLKDYYARLFGTTNETMTSTQTGDDSTTDTGEGSSTEGSEETGLMEEKESEVTPTGPEEKEEPVEEESTTSTEIPPRRETRERYTIFRNVEDGKLYARKFLFERFDIPIENAGVRVAGALCYPISEEDLREIEANANNDYSPYDVEYMNIRVVPTAGMENGERPPVDPTQPTDASTEWQIRDDTTGNEEPPIVPTDTEREPVAGEYAHTTSGGKEKIVIFKDVDIPNRFYAYKPVFDRFDIVPMGDEIRLGNIAGYPMHPEDVADIINNQNNDYSPYEVVFRDISFGKDLPTIPPTEPTIPPTEPTIPPTEPTTPPTGPTTPPTGPTTPPTEPTTPPTQPTTPEEDKNVQYITLYRDINDNNQVYASEETLRKFGVRIVGEATDINGVPCHKISSDTDQIINSIAKMSKTPKLVVRYENVKIKKLEEPQVRPHVETILDKITDGLDIHAKDAKHYQASNIKIAKGFRDELHSGNYAYNIVHVVPAILKAGVGVFRKLAGKLMTRARAKEAMSTIEERLANLSDEELDVLFEEYKGTQLKTDMNNQINPLILDRLRSYGLERVAKLNQQIKNDYIALFGLLGQIHALEEKIQQSGATQTLETQRMAFMEQAAKHVQSIIDNRNKANNILSSGVHGIEEDFKAVSSKLSYVGMRFGKANDFDNELQHQLGTFGQDLNTAIANGDVEGIVQNFMGLESCYYDNTEIHGSIVGRRSVGSKYYSPIAEQFDYRDDPFIRDLFTTVAVTTAAISAINAIRVHQIESQNVINNQQQQANAVNTQNQATMNQVHQTGQEIAGKRGTFQEGMEAQAEQDILTHADVRERAHLDLTNWHFNKLYRATDDAGHAAYNQFGADVTNQINSVTSDYAQGLITQAEALDRMSQISSNAQSTLYQVVDSSLKILRPYKATHPQFDLTAVEQSMDYIVAHPGAIADMNQAMVDVTNLADGLQSLQATPMAALTTLPSDMATTIIGAASAALLAANVASSMKNARRKGQYGNEITEMMDDYLHSDEAYATNTATVNR